MEKAPREWSFLFSSRKLLLGRSSGLGSLWLRLWLAQADFFYHRVELDFSHQLVYVCLRDSQRDRFHEKRHKRTWIREELD